MNTRKVYLLLLALVSPFAVAAQGDMDNILKGSLADANYLVKGYVSPLLNKIGAGLNQGWYNTGKPHKIAGVDITVSIAAVGIADADKVYEVDNTKLTNVSLVTTHTGQAVGATAKANVPSIFGPETTPVYEYDSDGVNFDGPPGVDLKKNLKINRLPVPVAHLGFGLPKGTEIKFRFIPTLDLGSTGKLGLFGVGVLHDVKQWIPVINHLPFDLSGFVGYSQFKVKNTFDPGQTGEFKVNATTIQALISKKLAVLTAYGAVGLNISKANLDMKGTYDFDGAGSGPTVKDPINIEASSSGPRLSVGLRLKLAIFTFHGDYTLQKFSTITAGFGISVR